MPRIWQEDFLKKCQTRGNKYQGVTLSYYKILIVPLLKGAVHCCNTKYELQKGALVRVTEIAWTPLAERDCCKRCTQRLGEAVSD